MCKLCPCDWYQHSKQVRRGGLWSAEAQLPPDAEADASALQTGLRAAPLSHIVGEGLGVRAKKRASPAHSELKRCTLIPCVPLEGVGFLRACLHAALPSRAFLLSCERGARAPSTRYAGNAGVPHAIPTAREKTYPLSCVPLSCRRARGSRRAHRRAPLHPSPTAWERGWG